MRYPAVNSPCSFRFGTGTRLVPNWLLGVGTWFVEDRKNCLKKFFYKPRTLGRGSWLVFYKKRRKWILGTLTGKTLQTEKNLRYQRSSLLVYFTQPGQKGGTDRGLRMMISFWKSSSKNWGSTIPKKIYQSTFSKRYLRPAWKRKGRTFNAAKYERTEDESCIVSRKSTSTFLLNFSVNLPRT